MEEIIMADSSVIKPKLRIILLYASAIPKGDNK